MRHRFITILLALLAVLPSLGASHQVPRLKAAMTIDANWDKPAWKDVPPVSLDHYMGEKPQHRPNTQVKMAYDDEAVYVIFRVEDRYVRARATEHQKGVCQDSCVEFFFTPGPDVAAGYFYLEMNCGGTMLFRFNGPDKLVAFTKEEYDTMAIAHSQPKTVDPEIEAPLTWTLEYRLPLALLKKACPVASPGPGVTWRANFYKCADDSSHPHWLTWSPVDNPTPQFHLPKFFGALEFQGAEADVKKAEPVNYPRAVEPAVKQALIPLPPGAVEPAGWLRDWALAARDGITGHLDERHATFRDGWKGVPIESTGAEPDGMGWPIEQCSYWLDGALRLGFVLHDDALLKKVKARLDPIVDGVNSGATSFVYWKKDLRPQGFNSWAHSHMGRALVAYYAATGEKRILDALIKVYADYQVPMGNLKFDDVSGLCNIDALLEAYAFSGDRRLLERAQAAMRSPAPEAEVQAWSEGRFSEGHAVVTYENFRLPALLYSWTGEQRLLQATLNGMDWIQGRHMLPYGTPSAEESMSGIGALRKTETCAVAAQAWSTAWLYRILGAGSYGDQLERAMFNTAPAPIARDFQTMCYYQSPNRLSTKLPCEQPKAPGPLGNSFHALGCPVTLCCVAAVNRIIPNYVIHMWMATEDRGLAATLYGPCTVSALVGQRVGVKITCQTNYPFDESLRLTIEPEKTVEFPLYLRIPAWCKQAQISVAGVPVEDRPDKKGFVRIVRAWAKGDVVDVRFPMVVQVVAGYETEFPAAVRKYFDFESPEVFTRRRLPYASVVRGPLLFALAIPDQDPNTPRADARWQFALDFAAERSGTDIALETKAMPQKWDWPLDAPVALRVPAQAFDWKPTDAQALPDAPVAGQGAETIRLVPYGCTKFRISMFPVTSKAWGNGPR